MGSFRRGPAARAAPCCSSSAATPGLLARLSHIERGHAVARDDVHIGAALEEEPRGVFMSHGGRRVQRRPLWNVPVVDARVDRRWILLQPCLDMLAKTERRRVMQVDRAMGPHPLHHVRLLVVVGPSQRRRVEWVVPVADAGTPLDEALHHLEIAAECGAMQHGAVIDANHVPVAVLLEQEVHCLALTPDVCIQQREPDRVAIVHVSALPAWAIQEPPLAIEERLQQIEQSQSRGGQEVRPRAERDHLLGRTGRMVAQRPVQRVLALHDRVSHRVRGAGPSVAR